MGNVKYTNKVVAWDLALGPADADAEDGNLWDDRMPFACFIVNQRANVGVAPEGAAMTFNIYKGAALTDVTSTPITIDDGETTSETSAVTPVYISGGNEFSDNEEIRVEITQVGTTAKGQRPTVRLYLLPK